MIKSIKKERNTKLDLIRFSGVLIIMIAHSNPPAWLFQFRNFGSPLLIFGSALTYAYIYKARGIDPAPFFRKRLKRLIIPAWLFLTFFFALAFSVFAILKKAFPFTKTMILESYTFYDGIGFVWIFKVYIILALITPLSLKWSKSTMNNTAYFSIIGAFYLMYELFVFFYFGSIPEEMRKFIAGVFLVVIPYSALYLYGLRVQTLSNAKVLGVSLGFLLIFVLMAAQKWKAFGSFVPTQSYKYPPTLYYLSYALFCINLFYYIVINYLDTKKSKFDTIIVWLSTNSLWIYLWHILGIYIWGFLFKNDSSTVIEVYMMFLLKTIFLLSFGVGLAYVQLAIVNKLSEKSGSGTRALLSYLK